MTYPPTIPRTGRVTTLQVQRALADIVEVLGSAPQGTAASVQARIADAEGQPAAADITDATAAGIALLTAANAGAQRTAMGVPATSHTHVADDISDATTIGKTIAKAADAAAVRAALGVGPSWDLVHRRTPPVWCTDFMHNNPVQKDFTGGAINSGTIASGVAASIVANHPGVMQLSSSTTPNSGYQFIIRGASILLAGSEQMDVVLYMPAAIDASTTIRLGFGDTTTSADNTDGVYFEIVSTTATGKTASNGSRTSTGTTYTLSAGTWYHFRVSLNAGATTATFKIFNDSGTELFSDTVSATIPTASGRELGGGIVATNSGSSAVPLVNIDYLCATLGRTVTRGALT